MESENPFKNVEIVSGNELKNYNPNELIYLDDEDDSHNRIITSIQIELRDNQNANVLNRTDDEDSHPLNIKIEPDIKTINESREASPDIFYSPPGPIVDDCLTFNSFTNIEEFESQTDEEQFQIIEKNVKVSTPKIQSPIDLGNNNNIHDHSYSQSQDPSEIKTCKDIIDSILQESNSKEHQNSLKLLASFTTYMKNQVVSDDEQNSYVAQYLSQMSKALDKMQKQKLRTQSTEEFTSDFEKIADACSKITEILEDQKQEEKMEVNEIKQEIAETKSIDKFIISMNIDNKEEVIKSEPEMTNTIQITDLKINNTDRNEDKIIDERNFNTNIKTLKVYAERIQNSNKESIEVCQKLLDAAYVSQEDVDNGMQKVSENLRDLINTFGEILTEMGCNDFDFNYFGNNKLQRSAKTRKTLLSDESDDENLSEIDEKIEKLCDFSSLKKPKTTKILNGIEKHSKIDKEKEKKKKIKEINEDEDLNSDLSDSDMDSLLSNASDNDQNLMKSDHSYISDEEEKMRQKLENKAKEDLLKDSDEGESDEASYHTSASSSLFSSSDDEKSTKKEKKDVVKKSNSETSINDCEKQDEMSKDLSQNVDKFESSSDSKEEKTENHSQKQRKKKVRKHSYEREIFNKKFLNDSDDTDDERVVRSPKTKIMKEEEKKDTQKTSRYSSKADNSNEVLDLSAFEGRSETRSIDLDKYFEKRAIQSEKSSLTQQQQQPCDLSKIKEQQESPKKNSNEQNINKQTAPSPNSFDDITYISLSSESDSEISSTNAEGQGRRRKQLTEEELKEETKKAKKEENERVKKLEEKSARLSQFLTQRLSQSDVIEANELILDFSEEKNLEIKVHPRLVDHLKPHQIDGVKFMYNNCYGSVDEVKNNNGSGCILAHCMGLGKTLQLITLLHTVIRYDELHTKRILVICPKSTILNWSDEFRKWLRGIECDKGKKLVVKYLEDNLKIEQKIKSLEDWYECENPSVFLINYESFRILVNWSGTNKRNKIPLSEDIVKKYQARIAKCLLDPGPNLVVCDEGHMIKNQKGATNNAVTKVVTKRRIILTGTPVQNALQEYYAMVQWIKPNLLGTAHEFNIIYANPIKDGQNKDSTASEIKKMKQKSYVLNKNLSKFVQRKDASVLKEFLPIKHEYCISVPLTEVQEKLYNYYLEKNRNDQMGRMLLPHYTALRKIWTHPKVLQYAHERALKGETRFAYQQQKNKISKNAFDEDGEGEAPDDVWDTSQGVTAVTNNWWSGMITKDDIESLNTSHKMRLLFEILKLSEKNGEKVLIFSSFVAVLDCIEQFMRAIHNQNTNPNAIRYGYDLYKSRWELGKDYYRLDGSTPKATRQQMINEFNRPGSSPRCFLISAKAGGQGINLTAANRCIIVDTSWNPANDNQNIFRIYRLGQTKTCYVYRFVAASTMEDRVYSRSVTKEAMSHRVVEKKQIERHYVKDELNELFVSYKLKPREGFLNFPKDEVLRDLLLKLPNSTYNFHEHDSLLENKPEDDLDEEEKKEAWQSYITESTHANRMNNVLQNNLNNMQGNALAKASELLKYYPDMNFYNSPWLMGGLSSTGLDPAGLNSSFYPMTSSLFASDLFKRIGSYDPLNLYSTPSLNSSSTTASTSSLMSSLLHAHNPISALGNLTTTAVATSYNANNIPPATNSIFAQPSTSSATTSTTVSPSSLLSNQKVIKMKNGNNQMQRTQPNMIRKPHQSISQFSGSIKSGNLPTSNSNSSINSSLLIPQNSSKNVSILPDSDISSSRYGIVQKATPGISNLVISSARSMVEGTSSRTNLVPNKTMNITTSQSSLLTSSISPQSTSKPTTMTVNKNNNFTKPAILKAKNSPNLKKIDDVNPLKSPQQMQSAKQLANIQKRYKMKTNVGQKRFMYSQQQDMNVNQKNSAQPQMITAQKSLSLQQQSLQRTPSQLSLSKIQTGVLNQKQGVAVNVGKQSKAVALNNSPKQVITPQTAPSKDILRQLEKNQTSLIDASKKSLSQKSLQSINFSPNNSVSIIKLNKPSSSGSSSLRTTSSQGTVVIPNSSNSYQKNIAVRSSQKIVKPMPMTQVVQQTIKRKNDINVGNQSQELKKIKLTQSQSLARSGTGSADKISEKSHVFELE